MPITWFHSRDLLVVSALGLMVTAEILMVWKDNWITKTVSILMLLVLFLGSMHSGEVFNWPWSYNYERVLVNQPYIKDQIQTQQNEAMYLPFRLRPMVFNKDVYIYDVLGNIFGFMSLNNLARVFLLANIYPFIYGLIESVKNINKWSTKINLVALGVGLFCAGLNRTPDKLNYFYLLTPVVVYFMWIGFKKVNLKIYSILMVISLLFLLV